MISFSISARAGATVVDFVIDGGVLAPSELPQAVEAFEALSLDMTKGLVLSGRGPVWLFAALAHAGHPFAWVGTFEPRLGGAIVVERHTEAAPGVGTVFSL